MSKCTRIIFHCAADYLAVVGGAVVPTPVVGEVGVIEFAVVGGAVVPTTVVGEAGMIEVDVVGELPFAGHRAAISPWMFAT